MTQDADTGDRPGPDDPAAPQQVTNVETFFDLVYVFAISQLASHLAEDLSWRGAAETLVMLVAVFTIWSFTVFESTMVLARKAGARWVILGVMVLGLVMNASITGAFAAAPWSFVAPMIAIQVGRSLATSRLDVQPVLRRHRFAMAVWAVLSAVPWCVGAAGTPHARLWWWTAAVVIDLAGALARHPLPGFAQEGLGRIRFDVAHQVERCRLFLLICLGEVIVRTGAGLATSPQDSGHLVSAVATMIGLVCVWLIFFGNAQELVDAWFERGAAEEASRLGRLATYGQQILVIAFVAYAVGTELVVGDPAEPLDTAATGLLFGGMALCLMSYTVFLVRLMGRRPLPHLVIGSVAVLAVAAATDLSRAPGIVACVALALVMAVIAWAHTRRGPRLIEPGPTPVEGSGPTGHG